MPLDLQMMKMLGIAEEKHEAALKRIRDHIEGRAASATKEKVSLDQFTG